MALLDNLALGLQVAATPRNLLYCFLGVTLGNLMGVIPGVGAVAAVSILLPVTYYVPPETGLIMLAGPALGAARVLSDAGWIPVSAMPFSPLTG